MIVCKFLSAENHTELVNTYYNSRLQYTMSPHTPFTILKKNTNVFRTKQIIACYINNELNKYIVNYYYSTVIVNMVIVKLITPIKTFKIYSNYVLNQMGVSP